MIMALATASQVIVGFAEANPQTIAFTVVKSEWGVFSQRYSAER